MERKNLSVNGSPESRRSYDTISILVVDDDTTCLSFVAALLKKFKYEVVTAKHPNDALCALRIKGGGFDLVVSDIHMPDMNGFQLQQVITHEFNLPVVLMSVDSKEVVVSKGMESGAALFISKPVSPNDLKDLWQFAVAMRNKRKQGKMNYSKRKTAQSECDVNTKKPKLIWSNGLHYRFLEAIRSIGLQRSVPKKILEVMNVPGLTRENVASHLQKYRMFLKRVSDASYKVEVGDDSRNCSASTLNRLNIPHFGAYSYHKDPSTSLIDHEQNNTRAANGRIAHNYYQTSPSFHTSDVSVVASTNINPTIVPPFEISETISALPSAHSESSVNFHSYKLQNSQYQYLGDSCYVPNIQEELSDFNGNYQQLLLSPPPSNLDLIQDLQNEGGNIFDDSPFCSSAFDIITTQQPPLNFNPSILLHNNPSVQLNIQNQLQLQGCDYTESSQLYDNSSYDQAAYAQVQGSTDSVEFTNASSQITIALEKCDEDDALESLLAFGPFGEDQIQTLEGI